MRRLIRLLPFALALLFCVVALAASSTKFVGTGADDGSTGFVTWSNPGRITADDASNATILLDDGDISHYLKGTTAGNLFSIPAGATIDGVEVTIERASGFGSTILDTTVKLVVGGVVSGDNKVEFASWPATMTAQVYGGPADLWGLSLTPADVNASNFGAVLTAEGATALDTGSVDYMSVTIYYTAPTGASSATTMLMGSNP